MLYLPALCVSPPPPPPTKENPDMVHRHPVNVVDVHFFQDNQPPSLRHANSQGPPVSEQILPNSADSTLLKNDGDVRNEQPPQATSENTEHLTDKQMQGQGIITHFQVQLGQ